MAACAASPPLQAFSVCYWSARCEGGLGLRADQEQTGMGAGDPPVTRPVSS